MALMMTIRVELCDETDADANRIVDGVYRATPGALQILRRHPKVRVDAIPSPVITLPRDQYKVLAE